MNAIVNGDPKQLPEMITVAELIVHLGHEPRGFGLAVALNGEVLPKSNWAATTLREEDQVEVLIASQGG